MADVNARIRVRPCRRRKEVVMLPPSSSTTDACGWQVMSASARGTIHERSDAPNQDALSWWSAEGEKALAVLCVADGHGSSEYTHSHIGARSQWNKPKCCW